MVKWQGGAGGIGVTSMDFGLIPLRCVSWDLLVAVIEAPGQSI